MQLRAKNTWKLDNQGQYSRHIGQKTTRTGKTSQHKFRLGPNLKEAKRREFQILQLWDTVERLSSDFFEPKWNNTTLGWAKQIAKGTFPPRVPMAEAETPRAYASRVLQIQYSYTGFPLEPDAVEAFGTGMDEIRRQPSTERTLLLRPVEERVVQPKDCPAVLEPDESVQRDQGFGVSEADLVTMKFTSQATEASQDSGPTLREALLAYIEHLKKECASPDTEAEGSEITAWGHTQIKQTETLIAHHADQPLSSIRLDEIEQMTNYWLRRPKKQGSDEHVARSTAKNHRAQLKKFFRWLHRSSSFDWAKPPEFNEIRGSVLRLESDRKQGFEQVPTFDVSEITALNKVATPLERIILLLGVNCGFGAMEIATLRLDELCLFTAHEQKYQRLLGSGTTDADSFIKRHRRKNVVYGEWLLFPQTVQGIEWLVQTRDRRAKQPYLLLNQNGDPYFKRTKGGNRNSQLPSRFNANIKRAIEAGDDVRALSLGKLRKTGGNFVRQFGDGEQLAVFHARCKTSDCDDMADVYTNRPFGKLFDTMRKIQTMMEPVFEAAGGEPFPTT